MVQHLELHVTWQWGSLSSNFSPSSFLHYLKGGTENMTVVWSWYQEVCTL